MHLLTRIKQLGQSKFVRNVAIVATGTAGAQAITMAFAPVITRLYGPEAFGLLGTFMAILGVQHGAAVLYCVRPSRSLRHGTLVIFRNYNKWWSNQGFQLWGNTAGFHL